MAHEVPKINGRNLGLFDLECTADLLQSDGPRAGGCGCAAGSPYLQQSPRHTLREDAAAPALDRIRISSPQGGDSLAGPQPSTQGVLVVGMGDEDRGDQGVGLHLMRCLAQMPWPRSVVFRPADASVPEQAQAFTRVILLDAMEGPERPGILYQVDPEHLLAKSVGGEGSGLGLLGMLPRAVLKRLSVFSVHPSTTSWGSTLSPEILASMPALMAYLRAYILQAAAEVAELN